MKVAILDYDYTLSDGYSRYDLAYLMEKEGVIGRGIKDEIDALQNSYESGEIDYNTKFRDDKAIFSRYYKGVKRTEIVRFILESYDIRSKLFPWVDDFMKILEEAGYMTVIISGCWDFILEEAQEIVEFDSFFGSEFEFIDGVATGAYATILDERKKREITETVLHGAERSFGMGDSTADFEFLDRVDIPFLYEPRFDALERSAEKPYKIVDRNTLLLELEQAIK